MDILTHKLCAKCRFDLPVADFGWKDVTKTRLKSWCKNCHAKFVKERYHAVGGYKEKRKVLRRFEAIERTYKISRGSYEELLLEQKGVCAICKHPETSKRRECLGVDHCHKTGIIRGLLCDRCNRALGMFQDSKEILKEAVEYLSRYQP